MTGENGTGVELVALQTVGSGIVVKTVIVRAVFMVTLHDDTADTEEEYHSCRNLEFPLEYFYFLLNQETRLYEESELTGGGWESGELRS